MFVFELFSLISALSSSFFAVSFESINLSLLDTLSSVFSSYASRSENTLFCSDLFIMACSLGGVKFPSTVVIELTLELKPKCLLLKTRVSLILCIAIDLEALVKALVSFIM